jgi:hypothetical protein
VWVLGGGGGWLVGCCRGCELDDEGGGAGCVWVWNDDANDHEKQKKEKSSGGLSETLCAHSCVRACVALSLMYVCRTCYLAIDHSLTLKGCLFWYCFIRSMLGNRCCFLCVWGGGGGGCGCGVDVCGWVGGWVGEKRGRGFEGWLALKKRHGRIHTKPHTHTHTQDLSLKKHISTHPHTSTPTNPLPPPL